MLLGLLDSNLTVTQGAALQPDYGCIFNVRFDLLDVGILDCLQHHFHNIHTSMQVGLLDIDICGPSIPKMLGLEGEEIHQSNAGWSPVYVEDNLGVMSIGEHEKPAACSLRRLQPCLRMLALVSACQHIYVHARDIHL